MGGDLRQQVADALNCQLSLLTLLEKERQLNNEDMIVDPNVLIVKIKQICEFFHAKASQPQYQRFARTALHIAALEGNTDAVVALIGSKVDIEAMDDKSFTPLHFAS